MGVRERVSNLRIFYIIDGFIERLNCRIELLLLLLCYSWCRCWCGKYFY